MTRLCIPARRGSAARAPLLSPFRQPNGAPSSSIGSRCHNLKNLYEEPEYSILSPLPVACQLGSSLGNTPSAASDDFFAYRTYSSSMARSQYRHRRSFINRTTTSPENKVQVNETSKAPFNRLFNPSDQRTNASSSSTGNYCLTLTRDFTKPDSGEPATRMIPLP